MNYGVTMQCIVYYILLAIFCETGAQRTSCEKEKKSVCGSMKNQQSSNHDYYEGGPETEDRLIRLEPTKVGEVVEIDIDGKKLKRITRAIRPPVYEIPDMLTDDECNTIIIQALRRGFQLSRERRGPRGDLAKDMQEKPLQNITRVSNTTFLTYSGTVLSSLRERVVQLTSVPKHIVSKSEPLQIVHYREGGHYHAHWDSNSNAKTKEPPCCHQAPTCRHGDFSPDCCALCRFATVLFYLNDVEEGGETAFPWALLNDDEEPPATKNSTIGNLSYNCNKANLVVKPRRGTAIFWYTHYLDKEGKLDDRDELSSHGGCDVIKGEKFIATTWINPP